MCERVSQRDGTYLVLLRLPQQTQNRTILSINEDEVPLFLFFLLGLSGVKTVRVECVLALGSGIGNPLTLLWLVLQLFAIQSDSSYQATYSLAA